MSEHKASIQWKRDTEDFNIKTYNRDHEVHFENGVVIPASAAVDFNGNSQLNNPEDLFVASVMGCHMLTFLAVASIKKFTVDLYTDNAEGILEKDSSGKMVMNRIILRPQIVFSGSHNPTPQELEELHEKAHNGCFIANSIKSVVIIEQQ
ncbi:MAG: OsmC family peroxiredoxin [Candidatus Marinimicrobia bacterium]|jgi:organic hydroperoxide reductase OsmC/OhrA|nr:OsmC family peroxiredoxin [Candidatus Neomarinimicrobiota bacterium]